MSRGDVPIEYDIKKHSDLDVRNLGLFTFWIEHNKIEEVYHLAALPGIRACDDRPLDAVSNNIIGTQNVSLICYSKNIPFVIASSFAVNGGHGVYADTKYLAEKIALFYGGRVARISNVFGGKDYLIKKNTVVAKLFNGTFKLEGDGKQTRDFIHVEDVCRAMTEIIKDPPGIYSISSGIITCINDLLCLYDMCSADIIKFEEVMRKRYQYENNRCWRKLV